MSMWHQNHEECKGMCTIKTKSLPCSDPDNGVRVQFHFNVKLPVNAYNFGTCKSCLNITQISITCMLGIRSTATEPNSTQNEEITTPKMISKSSGKMFLSFFIMSMSYSSRKKNNCVSLLQLNEFHNPICRVVFFSR